MIEQRSWILQRSNIELLRECQRLIQEQFSEKLSLTQNDLIEKIFLFSLNSSNPKFNDTVERLKDSLEEASFDLSELPGFEPPEPASDASVEDATAPPVSRSSEKVYRGRRVQVDVPEKTASGSMDPLRDEAVTDKAVKTQRRIYRGRLVEA